MIGGSDEVYKKNVAASVRAIRVSYLISIELRSSVSICRSAFVACIIHFAQPESQPRFSKTQQHGNPKNQAWNCCRACHADVQAERNQNHMEAAKADLVDDERMEELACKLADFFWSFAGSIMLFRLVPKQG